ncbi:MAG TPA: amidohydrolase family protein [Actinomycetota bacterium]|nr:amidohydrolase family protein [Actinomycetota bacterium]
MKTLYRATRVHAPPLGGEWVLVDERHVERVGAGDPPAADEVVDLAGATIMPGFIDAHVHLSGTGMAESGLSLHGTRSREEVLDAVRRHLSERPGPLLAQGFDESGWNRPDLPTLQELDAISREPLILVRIDGYLSIVNSAALEGSGAAQMPEVERDASGSATGRLRDDANAHVQRWHFESLTDLDIRDAQLRAARLAAERGVTCVHEMAIPDKRGMRDVEVLLAMRPDLPVHVVPYVAVQDLSFAIGRGLGQIGGDLFLDGSIGARTAALLAPYEDADSAGSLAYEDDDLAEFLHNAHLAGLQVGLHVIGDAAIEQALRVWERVYQSLDSRNRRHFRARRHRLEHFEMADQRRVERAAALGLAISIQPAFDAAWGQRGGMYEQRLGPERAAGMNPFRDLLARGLEVGAGSDTPVTELDPMLGIWALETHHDPSQRLARAEAITLYTRGAARLGHLQKRGRLEPGAAADLAVFEVDPLGVPDVRGLRPIVTVAEGRVVFQR